MVTLDMSKVFEADKHPDFLDEMNGTNTRNIIKRWLCGYLSGKETYVEFKNTRSARRVMWQGVPQGNVLSPTLFNFNSTLPTSLTSISIISDADDGAVLASRYDISDLCTKLKEFYPLYILDQK